MGTQLTPPLQTELHLTTDDGRFVIAVSLRNPTDDPLRLTTMSSQLFSVSLEGHHGTLLWEYSTMATQAVCHWELAPQSRITKHFAIPNEADARERATERLDRRRERWEENPDSDVFTNPENIEVDISPLNIDPQAPPRRSADTDDTEDTDDTDNTVVLHETAVEPDEAGIVNAVARLPKLHGLSHTVTRQYDLRTRPDRELDNDLPDETLDALEKKL